MVGFLCCPPNWLSCHHCLLVCTIPVVSSKFFCFLQKCSLSYVFIRSLYGYNCSVAFLPCGEPRTTCALTGGSAGFVKLSLVQAELVIVWAVSQFVSPCSWSHSVFAVTTLFLSGLCVAFGIVFLCSSCRFITL